MFLQRAIVSFALALGLAGSAGASSIGIFFDTAGTDCDTAIRQNSPFTFYIIANLRGDAAANGITGVEFRVTGNDPGWFVNWYSPPGFCDLCLGNLFDDGISGGWPSCQAPPSGMLLLGTVSGFSPVPAAERILRVEARNPPTHPSFPCPQVFLCDAEFTRLCVSGGEAFINRSVPCSVGVEPATWTHVKSLYTH